MLPTAQQVAQRAARVVVDGVRDALASGRSEPVIGLATGSSPLGLYAVLSGAVAAGEVSFERARGFALDEYVGLPAGHPESYRQVLLREVCGPLGLPPDRLHVPDGSWTLGGGARGRRCRLRAADRRGRWRRRADPRHRRERPPRLQRARLGADLPHPRQAALGAHPGRQRPLLRLPRRGADALRDPGSRDGARRSAARARRVRARQGCCRGGRGRGSAFGLVSRRRCSSGTPTRSWCSTRLPQRAWPTATTTTPRPRALSSSGSRVRVACGERGGAAAWRFEGRQWPLRGIVGGGCDAWDELGLWTTHRGQELVLHTPWTGIGAGRHARHLTSAALASQLFTQVVHTC